MMQEWLTFLEQIDPLVGGAIIVSLIAIGTPLMLSTTPLNVGAGALYGVTVGTVITLVGSTLGAWFCFLFARYCAREWARRKIQASPTLSALDRALAKSGVGIVALSRLSPLFPFAMSSFTFGACAVTTWDFIIGTAAGLAPGCAMISWIGVSVKDYSAADGAGHDNGDGHGGDGSDSIKLWATVTLTAASCAVLSWKVHRVIQDAAKNDKEMLAGHLP